MIPLVSIIVPNYNHAVYLEKRIESILNQTYQDFEVILLDDCSTDNSLEILHEYSKNPKVTHLVANKENTGSSFLQWDRGIKLAKGEYIWIAESDDWCEPSFLETLIPVLEKHPKIVLAFVQSCYMFGNNEIKWISVKNKLEKTKGGSSFIRENLLTGNAIYNASMAVFRKSAYNNKNTDYTNYKFCGDWLFWSEIAKKGNVFISGKVLNYFRNNNCDVSGKAYKTGLNFIEELQVLFSFLDNGIISQSEFFNGLSIKYLNYRLSRKKFTTDMKDQIENLFYTDGRTKRFKQQLLFNFRKMIIRQKVKVGLNKISNWIQP